MDVSFGRAVVPVVDQDAALAFYRDVLGCTVPYDGTGADSQRLVHVRFAGQPGVGIWLLRTDEPPPAAGPGSSCTPPSSQRPTRTWERQGVQLVREPATADGSRFMHVADPGGNEIVLVQPPKSV